MKIIKSIFKDLKSWNQFILNNWHWHGIIITLIAIPLGWLSIFLNFENNLEQIGEYFIPMFIIFLGSFGFEGLQQNGEIIDEKRRFESNKDGIFTTIIGCIVVIITRLILK